MLVIASNLNTLAIKLPGQVKYAGNEDNNKSKGAPHGYSPLSSTKLLIVNSIQSHLLNQRIELISKLYIPNCRMEKSLTTRTAITYTK